MKKLFYFLIGTLLSFQLLALNPEIFLSQYIKSTFTSSQGLPQNSVRSIVQTPDSYLWMGTEEGLVRFNGSEFEQFHLLDKMGKTSSMWINGLAALPDGQSLIVGTYGDGLFQFDFKTGKTSPLNTADGTMNRNINHLASDQSGIIWVASQGGLYRLSGKKVEEVDLSGSSAAPDIFSIYPSDDGLYFVDVKGDLYLLHDGKIKTLRKPDAKISMVIKDRRGRLWLGSRGKGIFLREDQHDGFIPIGGNRLRTSSIYALFEDRDENIWAGTLTNGLFRIGKDGSISPDSMKITYIATIFEDSESSLWIGSRSGGVTQLKEGKFVTFDEKSGLKSNDVIALGTYGHKLYVGAMGGGLSVIDLDKNRAHPAPFHPMIPRNCTVSSIFPGKKTYIAIVNTGVFVIEGDSIKEVKGLEKFPGKGRISAILVDSGGSLWVGTFGLGLAKISGGTTTLMTKESGLSHNYVTSLYEDKEGTLWVGSYQGVTKLNGTTARYITEKEGLSAAHVYSISADEKGRIWMSTKNGLSIYEKGNIVKMTRKEGLPLGVVYDTVFDNSGNIWLSGNNGLAKISRDQIEKFLGGKIHRVRCKLFKERDGLPSNEFNGAAQYNAVRSLDGRLWFSNLKGVVSFDPMRIPVNPDIPPVTIERLTADGKPRYMESGPVEIEPGVSSISFRYAALTFRENGSIRFSYKLDNFDKNWIDAGSRREAFYTNIPPGDYTFRVRAENIDGVKNREGAKIAFRLNPFMTQTTLFRYGCPLILLLLLIFPITKHIKLMSSRGKKLEQELASRKSLITESKHSDPVTSVKNRRYFTEVLRPEMSLLLEHSPYSNKRGSRKTYGIFLLSVGNLKEINRLYGIDAGDELLASVAQTILSMLGRENAVVRWRGGQFLVILRNKISHNLEVFAEEIRTTLESKHFVFEDTRRISASVEVAYLPYPFYPEKPDLLSLDKALLLMEETVLRSEKFDHEKRSSTGFFPGSSIPGPEDLERLFLSIDYCVENYFVSVRRS